MVKEERFLSRKTEIGMVFGIVFVGFLLRVAYLTQQSLWYDELFNVSVIKQNFLSNLALLWKLENHPPLYVILLKSWVEIFNGSDWSVRFFSVVSGTLFLVYLYKLLKTLTEQRTAFIALVLASVSPLLIYYAQEVRNFSVWLLFSTASFAYFFDWVLLGKKRVVWWVVCTILSLYTHIFSLLVLPIQLLLFFVIQFQKKEKPFSYISPSTIASLIILFISLIPLFIWAYLHKNSYAGFQKEFNLSHLLYLPFAWTYGLSLGPSINELHTMTSSEVFARYFVEVGASLFCMLVVFIAGIWVARKNTLLMWIAGVLMVLSGLIVATPLFSFIAFNVRSSLFLFPFFILFLAIGTRVLWHHTIGIIFPILMIGCMLLSSFQYYFTPKYFRDDIRGAVVITNSSPQTQVLTTGLCLDWVLQYYGDTRKNIYYFDEEGLDMLHKESKVWIIWNRLWVYQNFPLHHYLLREKFKVIREENVPGITVQLLEKEQ